MCLILNLPTSKKEIGPNCTNDMYIPGFFPRICSFCSKVVLNVGPCNAMSEDFWRHLKQMEVSENGCTIYRFIIHYRPSISRYPHFWKAPNVNSTVVGRMFSRIQATLSPRSHDLPVDVPKTNYRYFNNGL